MIQKTKILTLVLFLSFCSQQNELPQESTLIEVDENETSIADNQEPESSETTTSVVVEQVEKLSLIHI